MTGWIAPYDTAVKPPCPDGCTKAGRRLAPNAVVDQTVGAPSGAQNIPYGVPSGPALGGLQNCRTTDIACANRGIFGSGALRTRLI
jgi:hypothetical protein